MSECTNKHWSLLLSPTLEHFVASENPSSPFPMPTVEQTVGNRNDRRNLGSPGGRGARLTMVALAKAKASLSGESGKLIRSVAPDFQNNTNTQDNLHDQSGVFPVLKVALRKCRLEGREQPEGREHCDSRNCCNSGQFDCN